MARIESVTRLHRLLELIDPADIAEFVDAKHYVIGDDLFPAMGRADVQRSISAMITAEMARLPFSRILVEFSPAPSIARFVWLNEGNGHIQALTAMLTNKGLATVPSELASVHIQADELAIHGAASENDGQAISLGAAFALLMLNIRGIEKRRIEPRALNKARASRGQRPVPDHTVLKIGVVYDRRGIPVYGAEALRSVYLRAGHVRNQAVGKGWMEHRRVYIEPQLVNYRDGDAAPMVRTKIVRMG